MPNEEKMYCALLLTGFITVSMPMSTGFWKSVRGGAVGFAESCNAAGGDCTVINLPDLGVTGNSHFMFQELNNDLLADYIAAWLESRGLD